MASSQHDDKIKPSLIKGFRKLLPVMVLFVLCFIAITTVIYFIKQPAIPLNKAHSILPVKDTSKNEIAGYWVARDINLITDTLLKKQVTYGKELIAHTAKYFGPKGSLLKINNGLNCQNCHLQAGTAVYGNNYGSVASLYPKFRARSGSIENIYKRINDCFERSLNGKAIDTAGKEMQAMAAYINFIGSNVEKGKAAAGAGFKELAYLDRAADTAKGKSVYSSKCQTCHKANGEGQLNADGNEFIFPALWGSNSYNDGAGMYRISNFAKYIKFNMPQGATHLRPQLTDEEAWDAAAFINSQKRPHKNISKDWPDISKKPVDYPFGPYADKFLEPQHKYGPFKSIVTVQHKTK